MKILKIQLLLLFLLPVYFSRPKQQKNKDIPSFSSYLTPTRSKWRTQFTTSSLKDPTVLSKPAFNYLTLKTPAKKITDRFPNIISSVTNGKEFNLEQIDRLLEISGKNRVKEFDSEKKEVSFELHVREGDQDIKNLTASEALRENWRIKYVNVEDGYQPKVDIFDKFEDSVSPKGLDNLVYLSVLKDLVYEDKAVLKNLLGKEFV
eukprot:snap_masked-scaffold_10-processed-gene-2.18-mRNA-1 protein AED:1.00 eAED:1.00 QI:0/-1/0/0/-1/1/1/0/204